MVCFNTKVWACSLLLALLAKQILAYTSILSFRRANSATITLKIGHRSQPNSSCLKKSFFTLPSSSSDDPEETAKKYGLEAGLIKAMSDKEGEQKIKPKDLLAKYGVAYLATSITLAIISYAICYALVSNGVDVSSLLEKIGIKSGAAASNAGTAAIAYAVHKAASPIRFPPTVALTPIVAGFLGKTPKGEKKE